MEERSDSTVRARRAAPIDDIDDELAEDPHARRRLREILRERESATERFRALKRRLLEKR